MDDRTFWTEQIKEHILFIYLMLEDKEYKNKTLEYMKIWKKPEKWIDDDWVKNTEDLLQFQRDIMEVLSTGKWLGWIFYSFLEHICDETEFAIKKVREIDMSDKEEVMFWKDVIKDHSSLDIHLLDPSEEKYISTIEDIKNNISGLDPESKSYILMTYQYAEELDKFHQGLQNKEVKLIIHPLLLQHMIREEDRAKDELKRFI